MIIALWLLIMVNVIFLYLEILCQNLFFLNLTNDFCSHWLSLSFHQAFEQDPFYRNWGWFSFYKKSQALFLHLIVCHLDDWDVELYYHMQRWRCLHQLTADVKLVHSTFVVKLDGLDCLPAIQAPCCCYCECLQVFRSQVLILLHCWLVKFTDA